jgi:excinuclease UvrABC nuclease subunit
MLEDDIVKHVCVFYDDDEISRCVSGKKGLSSAKEHRNSVHKQKQLLLCNLNEAYSLLEQGMQM